MPKRHLNDRFVQNIRPTGTRDIRPDAEGRLEIGDSACEGLILRVTKSGRKTFSFIYRMPGARQERGKFLAGPQERITLGPYPAVGLKDARTKASAFREQIFTGINPRTQQQHQAANTFDVVLEQFIELRVQPRVKQWRNVKQILEKHVSPVWGARPVAEITRSDAHELLDEVESIGARREVRKHLHTLFDWAMDRSIVDINPLHRLKRPELVANQNVRTPLTDEQIRELWQVTGEVGQQLRLLLLTGCRKAEIGRGRWADIDEGKRQLVIAADRQKSSRDTIVPFSEPAWQVVEEITREGRFLFGRNGRYLDSSALAPVQEQLSFHLRPHDLRATCSTRMSALGIPDLVVSLCLGHKVKGLHGIYNKYSYLPEKTEAFAKYGEHIMDVVSCE